MGKEQELLEAARTGNVATIERLLANRVRRSAGGSALTSALASLWNFKGVNVQCQDANGETPLHLAALHGFRDVVSLLLQNEALVNATDERGCTPLHLAAWSGRSDICTLLLQPSAVPAQVNAQNGDGDTPLLCAAQHGHCITVAVLLQDRADPSIRNLGEFSPLDLAAQYGRLDVVKQLISTHPSLVNSLIPNHSPLHLASRSGHRAVVEYLLNSGISVNLKADSGTSLHEAATYCKTDVIKLLLDRGVEVDAEDKRGLTASDILKSLPSQKAHDATKLINDHIKGLMKVVMQDRTPSEDEYEFGVLEEPIPIPESEMPVTPPVLMGVTSSDLYAKVNKDKDSSSIVEKTSSVSPDLSPPPLPPRTPSVRCSQSSSDSNPHSPPVSVSPVGPVYMSMAAKTEQGIKEPPKKPARRRTQRLSHSGQDVENRAEPDDQGLVSDSSASSQHHEKSESETYMTMSSVSHSKEPPKLPSPVYCNVQPSAESQRLRESLKGDTLVDNAQDHARGLSSNEPEATLLHITEKGDALSLSKGDNSAVLEGDNSEVAEGDHSTQSKGNHSIDSKGDNSQDVKASVASQGTASEIAEEDLPNDVFIDQESSPKPINVSEAAPITVPTFTGNSVQKPTSLEFAARKRGYDVPLSPTGYVQPPTPDYPPPSPKTALKGITHKINPQEKRKSKDMETLTEAALLAQSEEEASKKDNSDVEEVSTAPPEGSVEPPPLPKERLPSQVLETVVERVEENNQTGSSTQANVDTSTEHVQLRQRNSSQASDGEADTSVFAGLLRGSTPGGPRNVVSQICESDVVRRIKTKRTSAPLPKVDAVMEEDKDGIDPDAVLSGLDDALKSNGATENGATHLKSPEDGIDENEEWANIAATLAEFGVGMARESVFVREYEADFARLLAGTCLAPKPKPTTNNIQSVGEWLETLRLGQYENTLVANGFDDTDFLGGNVMEEQDLEAIGIMDKDHRHKLLTAVSALPKLQPIDQAKLPPSVEEWLKSLQLEQYLDTFNNHKYDTMERVIKVWELELTNVLDITSIGHRKRILASLGNRPPPERINSEKSPNIVKKNLSLKGVEVISPFEHIDLYKDYTGVRSTAVDDPRAPEPSQNPLLMFGTGNDALSQGQHIRDSTIHIRPPHLAHTTGSVRQWRHRPEILIKGCCNYTAQYLGSTLVKELNGPESTQEGISKLKKSTEVIAKIPTIMLSISYRGVKFIDAKSKKVICDHEIANIFCACQDSEHLNFFAYITKDRESQKHYCHVFSVRSRELAGEIILTLGEAFEIAYQMALKEKAEEDAIEFEKKLSPSDQEDTTSASSKASLNTL